MQNYFKSKAYTLIFFFQKWFVERHFSERFQRRFDRLKKAGKHFIQEQPYDDFAQNVETEIQTSGDFLVNTLPQVSVLIEELSNVYDELSNCGNTTRKLHLTFTSLENVIGNSDETHKVSNNQILE